MVSLWPWRSDDSSPASFEKTLSALSTKITATQARLEGLRTASRRVRLLSTLYLSFAYLVYTIVDLLVIGWPNMGPWEWTGVAGGPVFIYVTRTALSTFYGLRIESLSAKLKEQQTERAKTIQKLKDATRYDSTLELLEKYGGPENKPAKKGRRGDSAEGEGPQSGEKKSRHSLGPGGTGRSAILPPATANIPRGDRGPGTPAPGTPQPGSRSHLGTPQPSHGPTDAMMPSAEFAPNAFGPASVPGVATQQFDAGGGASHWYDRVLDLLLGEDETAPKNRIVLICKECRLVNGQAPPGTGSLAEVGMWKCMACGTANGVVDEGKQIVREVLAQSSKPHVDRPATPDRASEADNEEGSSGMVEVEMEDETKMDDSAETQTHEPDQGGQVAVRKRRGKSTK